MYKQLFVATLISKQQLEIQSPRDWNFTCILIETSRRKKKHDQSASATWHKKPYLSTRLSLRTRLLIGFFQRFCSKTNLHFRLLKCFVLEHSSLITQWPYSVSSIFVIWMFPIHFTSVKKNYRLIRSDFTERCFWSLIKKRKRKPVQSVLR